MAEENTMSEENKKTIIAFIAGLLVGGLLVFIFGGSSAPTVEEPADIEDEETEVIEDLEDIETETPNTATVTTPTPPSGTSAGASASGGAITVADQPAGGTVVFGNAILPTDEGWVAVREYRDGRLAGILGAARWNKATGLQPSSVRLLRPTIAGNTYAIVFYTDNGDRVFSLAHDMQMDGVMETFRAE